MLGRYSRESRQPSQQAGNRRVLYWVDTMHPDYKSDHPGIAPDCGMPLEPVYADDANHAPASLLTKLPQGVVSIDGTTQELLGIRMATVERNVAPHIIRVLGRVAPEDTRVYRINSGTEGLELSCSFQNHAGSIFAAATRDAVNPQLARCNS